MCKRPAATPSYIGTRHPTLRVVADPSRSAAGLSVADADDDAPDEREPLPSLGELQRRSDAQGDTFERAVARWRARGYRVQYRDEYLVQLVRWHRPDWLLAACVLAGLAGLLFLSAARRARLTQPWHVVTLARTPDERVITHEQWASRPPAA